MALALGIDTGGTFTDSVIFDLTAEKVLAKAKAPTTYDDLTKGIWSSINNLAFEKFTEIKLVSLSTTMATNAIVEGRGCEVGLILIGEEPTGPLPVKYYAVVPGGHDIRGNQREELNLQEVEIVLEKFKDKVEAIAVSGFASVRNPEHELAVKGLIEQKLKLPVVCGHQLTTSLGFHERTVTAALNARLIPILKSLIDSTKRVLAEKKIAAPLMIVKGNGTLMNEALAVEKPIETILSGPAASIIGARTLTDAGQAMVLDMGGTTTDIAFLNKGFPRINPEGATVGGWLTRVEAADIYTYGLGGDSYLRMNKEGKLLIGPQKVWPLAFVGMNYPYLVEEFTLQRINRVRLRVPDLVDGYLLLSTNNLSTLTELEKSALELLKSGPHTLYYLANSLNKNPFSFNLDSLVQSGIVAKVAVTPTDILHAQGSYTAGNREIALLGVEMLAEISGECPEAFLKATFEQIVENICAAVLKSALTFEGAPASTISNLEGDYFFQKLLRPENEGVLHTTLNLRVPILGIGAPVAAYLPAVARKLNAELLIPANSDVANAVGAAAGKVVEKVGMVIKPSPLGYILYSQWERRAFTDLAEAREYALIEAEKYALEMANKAGVGDCKVMKKCQDKYLQGGLGPYLETIIEVEVIGRPIW